MTDREKVNVRGLALEVLLEVTEQKEYSHLALRGALEKYQYLEKQDRAFLTRLAEGTVERLLELDYIINRFSKVPVHKMKPVIRGILRMSVYQIKYMDRIPDAAVCNEAVKLAGKKGFSSLKGFVNGVLRNISRNLGTVEYPDLSVKYSTPEWIVQQWTDEYGEETARKMLESQYEERPITVRVNLHRISRESLMERLASEGVRARKVEGIDCALEISGYDYLAAAPRRGDYCIDVCAAPGGKSLHLADLLDGTGMVEARDLTEYKVQLIEENIARSGMTNIRAVQWDATVPDEVSAGKADVVLADLPCSGLGVLNKKRDLKYRMTPEQEKELVHLQRRILETVQQYVKPGGTLVYSTCTVHREENEGNTAWFLEHFPFVLKEQIQMLPGRDPWDGFYIAKMEKRQND